MAEVISVSALNRYVKNLLDVNDVLFDLALRALYCRFATYSLNISDVSFTVNRDIGFLTLPVLFL